MEKFEQLTQPEFGLIYDKSKRVLDDYLIKIGLLKTLLVKHPLLKISDGIDRLVKKNSPFIPEYANSYVASEFNPNTQHLRKDENGRENFYSVYAIQFYKKIF